MIRTYQDRRPGAAAVATDLGPIDFAAGGTGARRPWRPGRGRRGVRAGPPPGARRRSADGHPPRRRSALGGRRQPAMTRDPRSVRGPGRQPRAAATQQIRAAYVARARAAHPDLVGGRGLDVMRALNEAWDILKDAAPRSAYDATLGRRHDRGIHRARDRRAAPEPTPTGRSGPGRWARRPGARSGRCWTSASSRAGRSARSPGGTAATSVAPRPARGQADSPARSTGSSIRRPRKTTRAEAAAAGRAGSAWRREALASAACRASARPSPAFAWASWICLNTLPMPGRMRSRAAASASRSRRRMRAASRASMSSSRAPGSSGMAGSSAQPAAASTPSARLRAVPKADEAQRRTRSSASAPARTGRRTAGSRSSSRRAAGCSSTPSRRTSSACRWRAGRSRRSTRRATRSRRRDPDRRRAVDDRAPPCGREGRRSSDAAGRRRRPSARRAPKRRRIRPRSSSARSATVDGDALRALWKEAGFRSLGDDDKSLARLARRNPGPGARGDGRRADRRLRAGRVGRPAGLDLPRRDGADEPSPRRRRAQARRAGRGRAARPRLHPKVNVLVRDGHATAARGAAGQRTLGYERRRRVSGTVRQGARRPG